MTRRLLLVEPSTTMRHVLEKHVRALGHEIEATDSYTEAREVLERQYRAFESDVAGVLLGWPSLPDDDAAALAERLEGEDLADLPVVVMSTDMRAETRAWVAGRERSALLPWKGYLGIDAALERLLDTADVPREPGTRFDNADVHLLVVDDSRTIRQSLRDLFERHGYRVSVAADRDEALAVARATRVDVAVLDFYLEETTGDALCRDLVSDPACGEVTCAILTGTCADHVIKRSLRAGAVECMFKNESGELLLARVDAIARFAHRRRELSSGVGRLERVVDALAGAAFVIDADEVVRHASASALAELGGAVAEDVIGRPATAFLDVERLPEPGAREVPMTWRDAAGGVLRVSVSRLALSGGPPGGRSGDETSLLGFERLPPADASDVDTPEGAVPNEAAPGEAHGENAHGENAPGEVVPGAVGPVEVALVASATDPAAVLARRGLPPAALPFVEQLIRHVDTVGTRPDRVSLLVLGVRERGDDGVHEPVGEALARRVEAGLGRLYRRAHHVAALGGHRFGLLIRHSDAAQSYLLTRRLMQLGDAMLVADGGPALASTGCLVGLDAHPGRSAEFLIAHALRGLDMVDERGVDQALLLDLKRMLAVYPKPVATDDPRSGVSDASDVTDGADGDPEGDDGTTPSD